MEIEQAFKGRVSVDEIDASACLLMSYIMQAIKRWN